jgi:hypothetical protein
MTSLALFFSLFVEHGYFRKKQNLFLDFIPLGITTLLINKDLLFLRKRADGFELYPDMKRAGMIAEYLTEENSDCLEFLMAIKNHDFLNFTEPDIPGGSFLLLQKPGRSSPGKPVLLHQSDFVSAGDLADLSSGEASAIPQEYLLKPFSFALIRVPLSRKGREVKLTDKNGTLVATTATIRFMARSTCWKYLFKTMEEPQFDTMQVVDAKGQYKFSKMVAGQDADGSIMHVAESVGNIPLREISDYHFQLKGIQNGIEHTIIQHLAEPNPDFLSRVNGKLTSTIFIYY